MSDNFGNTYENMQNVSTNQNNDKSVVAKKSNKGLIITIIISLVVLIAAGGVVSCFCMSGCKTVAKEEQVNGSNNLFSEGLIPAKSGDKWGYIDKTGEYVIEPKFEEASAFSEGLAKVKINGKYSYVDKNGKLAVSTMFFDADDFSNGLAAVRKDFYWNYIDKKGNVVIEGEYLRATPFSDDGYAVVVNLDDKYILIDKDGKQVGNTEFDVLSTYDEKRCKYSGCLEFVASDDEDGYCNNHKGTTEKTDEPVASADD